VTRKFLITSHGASLVAHSAGVGKWWVLPLCSMKTIWRLCRTCSFVDLQFASNPTFDPKPSSANRPPRPHCLDSADFTFSWLGSDLPIPKKSTREYSGLPTRELGSSSLPQADRCCTPRRFDREGAALSQFTEAAGSGCSTEPAMFEQYKHVLMGDVRFYHSLFLPREMLTGGLVHLASAHSSKGIAVPSAGRMAAKRCCIRMYRTSTYSLLANLIQFPQFPRPIHRSTFIPNHCLFLDPFPITEQSHVRKWRRHVIEGSSAKAGEYQL